MRDGLGRGVDGCWGCEERREEVEWNGIWTCESGAAFSSGADTFVQSLELRRRYGSPV